MMRAETTTGLRRILSLPAVYEGYLRLVRAAVGSITHDLRHDLHVIPSTTLIMTCLP